MPSIKNVIATGTRKQPTTKVGRFWQALHSEREFSAAYIKAVLMDEPDDAIAEALDIINLSPKDMELSEQEYKAFVRGLTPSGELEVTAWGGYYVTDPLPSGQVFALLVSSLDNRVYWGTVDGFIERCWLDCEVAYDLGPDTALSFSSHACDVVLSFTRDYDQETGDIGEGSVKCTIGNTTVYAAKATPPLPALPARVGVKASILQNDPDPDKHFLLSDNLKTYTTIASYTMNVVTVVLYFCPGLRRQIARQIQGLRRRVRETMDYCLGVEHSRLSHTYVDLSQAHGTLITHVEQILNKKLDSEGIDYNKTSVGEVIDSLGLKKYTTMALEGSLITHIQDTISSDASIIQDDLPPPLDEKAGAETPGWIEKIARDRTALVMFHFQEGSEGTSALLESTVLEHRKEFYRSHVTTLDGQIEGIEKFIDRASRNILLWRGRIQDAQERAEKLKQEGKLDEAAEEERRIEKLKEDIRKEDKAVEQKEKERSKAQGDKHDAETKRDERDHEIEEHKRKWEEEAKKH